jgi:hypothetical protein
MRLLSGTIFGPGETVEAPDDIARGRLVSGWVHEQKTDNKKRLSGYRAGGPRTKKS